MKNIPTDLTSNPGGQLAPEAIVGRDELISNIWKILEGRSVYMNDLRRIGKTQIMVKMKAEAPEGWHPVKRDLGGLHSAAEFASRTYRDAAEVLGLKKRTLRGMTTMLGKIGGAEVAGVLKLPDGSPAHWKDVLFRTFADIEDEMKVLEAETGRTERMVFLWDEVPFLLDNIARRENASVAMEVLDALRAFGQDHDHVRLVLTGSIGLHHLLVDLQAKDYGNSPLNRMEHVQPGPLSPAHARELAAGLLRGGGFRCGELGQCANAVADKVGYVAFYVHKLISRLPKDLELTPGKIDECLSREIMSNERDDWDFAHYRSRLKKYYGKNETLALLVLDTVAVAQPQGFRGIRKAVAAQQAGFSEDEGLRDLLKLLCRDHYLVRTENGAYSFYLELIRRWWCADRSLGA
jgi:hypothetical protein